MKAEYRAISVVFNSELEIVTETHYKWENPELNEEMFNEVLNKCIEYIHKIEDGFRVSGEIVYFDENASYNRICRMSGKASIHRNTLTIEADEKSITIPV